MARSHVEFIFAQALGWATTSPLPRREGLHWKLLSVDSDNGEVSGLLRFPLAWTEHVCSDFQEEIYVLEGALRLDHGVVARDGYARIDAGRRTRWQADAGTVALVFSNAASPGAAGLFLRDTTAMRWDRSGVPAELDYMGIARKALFVDDDTGNHRTWLLTTAPQCAPLGKQLERETHGCAEEVFMLSGDITGPQGVMSPGAYFWRPAQTLHGPFGSREGSLAFCRFRHGEQTTRFHDATLPFAFEAAYRPHLPFELNHLRHYAGRCEDRY